MSIKLEQHWFTRMVYSRAMAGNLVKLFFRHYDPRAAVFEDTNVQTAAPAPRGEAASWAKEEQERVDRQRSFIDKSIPALKKMRKRGGLVLRDVDEVLTAKLGGPASVGEFPFKGAAQYYEWASPYKLLHNVQQCVQHLSCPRPSVN
jgi:predicted alpha/beta-fold hydrolase